MWTQSGNLNQSINQVVLSPKGSVNTAHALIIDFQSSIL